jgi:hypothetical protein
VVGGDEEHDAVVVQKRAAATLLERFGNGLRARGADFGDALDQPELAIERRCWDTLSIRHPIGPF